ncbi:hypothetical protein GJ496_002976 [Pomphorhynchus laevis]|nr:hypothetical protein GJ496_002976 [Pomphorhynchus laevis]
MDVIINQVKQIEECVGTLEVYLNAVDQYGAKLITSTPNSSNNLKVMIKVLCQFDVIFNVLSNGTVQFDLKDNNSSLLPYFQCSNRIDNQSFNTISEALEYINEELVDYEDLIVQLTSLKNRLSYDLIWCAQKCTITLNNIPTSNGKFVKCTVKIDPYLPRNMPQKITLETENIVETLDISEDNWIEDADLWLNIKELICERSE